MIALSPPMASPSLGTPSLGQKHHLEAKGIEVSPLAEPAAKESVHRLKASGIGARQPDRGRPKAITSALANELKAALEVNLRSNPKFPKLPLQGISIRFVKDQIRLKGKQPPSAIIIGRQIV